MDRRAGKIESKTNRDGESGLDRPLRIAQVASPMEAVPPPGYGGTERVVAELVTELSRRGHQVTLFASGDSRVPVELQATVPAALRPADEMDDFWPYTITTILDVLDRADEFDIVHAHLEWPGLLLSAMSGVPLVLTFHGRLDYPWSGRALAHVKHGLVAISQAQAGAHHEVKWEAIIHNGLDLSRAPHEGPRGPNLCFVGRIAPEKGAVDAISIACRTGRPLRIAAKVGVTAKEKAYFEEVFKPALKTADVEFLGELNGADRDKLLCESYATLMPGSWPEPFGLVAIESLACGTPVLSRRVGALPEIVREGIDGFFGDDDIALAYRVDQVDKLDRNQIHDSVVDRFSARRMVDAYEQVYARMLRERNGKKKR